MKIFFRLFAILFPILLLVSIYRKLNGVSEPLTITYLLNSLSNFDFSFDDTKRVIDYIKVSFNNTLSFSNIKGISDFFDWLASWFSFIIIEPINLLIAVVKDIGNTLLSIFNTIFTILGLT